MRSAGLLAGAAVVALTVGACASAPGPVPGVGASPSTSTSASGVASASAATPSASVPRGTPGAAYLDVAYASDDSVSHRLDLYLPTTPGPSATVLFLHGGSWAIGRKTMLGGYGALRDALLARGYAVASAEFRPSTSARFPAQLDDVKAAIRFLRANAGGLTLKPDTLVLAGDSSGAHLAQFAALTGDDPAWEGTVGTTGVSTKASAVVSFYGVSDLTRLTSDQDAAGCQFDAATTGVLITLLGGDPAGAAREEALRASPVSHAGGARTPMLLLHGTKDCLVPAAQSQRMADALRAAGTPVQLELLPAGHDDGAFYTDQVLRGLVLPFLDRTLG